jgi:YHS domain-containing protein
VSSPTVSAFDPICGMRLEASQIAASCVYIGQTYAFCSVECYDLFTRAPEIHVTRLAHEPEQSAGHVCPLQRRMRADSAESSQ